MKYVNIISSLSIMISLASIDLTFRNKERHKHFTNCLILNSALMDFTRDETNRALKECSKYKVFNTTAKCYDAVLNWQELSYAQDFKTLKQLDCI